MDPSLFPTMLPFTGLRRVFLARRTVLTLILLNLLVVGLAALVPQRIGTSALEFEQWQEAHPAWSPAVDRFGLDHLFSTPWFGLLLSLTLVALLFSLSMQVKRAWRRTFTLEAGVGSGPWLPLTLPTEFVHQAIRRAGYRRVTVAGRQRRYLKNPWGYWGNPLLHGGMVITMAASLLMALTQQRGLLRLNEGEVQGPGAAWLYREQGVFASPLDLPEAIGLLYVLPEFWEESGELKRLSSGVRLVDPRQEGESRLTLTTDAIVTRHGMRFYQGLGFGHSFAVELSRGNGQKTAALLAIQHPEKRGVAGYGNFRLEGVPYLIKAKYLQAQAQKTLGLATPTLTLRLTDGDKTVAELTLSPGASGDLGPYLVRLDQVGRWSSLVVTRLHGMALVFFGFSLIVAGSALIYLCPVRELLVASEGEGVLLSWRAEKFALFYREEFETLLHGLRTWNQR